MRKGGNNANKETIETPGDKKEKKKRNKAISERQRTKQVVGGGVLGGDTEQ